MHERHIVYVDYVSRSYQIEECRISSSTKSKLIHLGNRRSLQLQKSLPKSHCRSEEAVHWSKRRKHQEVRQSRCRRRFSTYHDLVNLVVGDESGKHKNQEERRVTISETKKTWRTVILTVFFCDLSWSCIIFVFSLGLSQVFCWMWQAWWPFRMRNRNRSSAARLPGRQSSMCFSCCTIWSFAFWYFIASVFAFLAHLQILGIYVEGTRTCFQSRNEKYLQIFSSCCRPSSHPGETNRMLQSTPSPVPAWHHFHRGKSS